MALLVAVTGAINLGIVLILFEFLIVLGMRQMGLAMAARRLALLQREEIRSEILSADPASPESDTAKIRRMRARR
jgi:hypothetical protein